MVATIVELTNSSGFPRSYQSASAAIVTKGQILTLFDARIASYALVDGAMCAGVAAMDKKADNSTRVTVFTDCIIDVAASGAIAVGQPVCLNAFGNVRLADTAASGAQILGYALETSSANEVINVRVRL